MLVNEFNPVFIRGIFLFELAGLGIPKSLFVGAPDLRITSVSFDFLVVCCDFGTKIGYPDGTHICR
ncbi:hypothetical protein [Agrobacterium vitis]|uniref:hypothetical protein n=1 Tax=Agrobacterium vitis TaxID=373 RepID=UPI0020339398|nr:hypothetical protein [Agrobacterium vitis]MCM2450018.1 hypothetical protein [Agrobacterium vitis]MCM2470350.1 hypothetical protein [Agrobacterium vitis]